MTKSNLNAFQALQNALIARHNSEVEARNGEETADTKALVLFINKFDQSAINAGFQKIARWSNQSADELARVFTITDKKSDRFVNLKGARKFLGLVALIGGETVKLDTHLANFLTVALTQVIHGQYAIFKNAVVGAEMSQKDIRSSLGYKAGETSEEMDYFISLDRADFGITTISTQTSQIKTMLIAVGLATGIKGKATGVVLSGEFVRALNGLKDKFGYCAESRGYNGAYAL